jgi:diguanylate cyclase (GGDEF)-like protein/PAS domain S-box-containing protein
VPLLAQAPVPMSAGRNNVDAEPRTATERVLADSLSRAVSRIAELEARYRSLTEQVPAVIYRCEVTAEGAFTFMSAYIETILDYRPEDFLADASLWDRCIHADDAEEVMARYTETNRTLAPFDMEYRMLARNGKVVWVHDTSRVVRGPGGEALFWHGILTDITQGKEAEHAIRLSERLYRSVVDSSPDGIALRDLQGTILTANHQLAALLGYDRAEDIRGKTLMEHLRPFEIEEEGEEIVEPAGAEDAPQRNARYLMVRRDGSTGPVEISSATIFDDDGTPIATTSTIRDITERTRLEEHLRFQALHDSLTGLPNRTLLFDRLEQSIRSARRGEQTVALLLLDLDLFKEVNDTLGHEAGDVVLREVASRLRGVLRASDTIARLGGDEFAIVLPGSDADGARQIAEKIHSVLSAPVHVHSHSMPVAASVGIVLHPAHGKDGATLLQHADLAMYDAKRSGKGTVIYDPSFL